MRQCVGQSEEKPQTRKGCFDNLLLKGKLYFDEDIKTENGLKTALFCVEPNGENRELYMYLDHDENFAGQRYDIHRGTVYCWSYETTVCQSEPVITSKIICWDIEKNGA